MLSFNSHNLMRPGRSQLSIGCHTFTNRKPYLKLLCENLSMMLSQTHRCTMRVRIVYQKRILFLRVKSECLVEGLVVVLYLALTA